jgi:hypothetical protein
MRSSILTLLTSIAYVSAYAPQEPRYLRLAYACEDGQSPTKPCGGEKKEHVIIHFLLF